MNYKIFISMLVLYLCLYADDSSQYNNPSVGSRQQDSSQQYGPLSFDSKKGARYNYHNKALNSSTVGSINSQSSSQLFGEQENRQKNFRQKSHKKLNIPTVGSRQTSSDNVFNDL